MPWYNSGTVAVTNNSATVTGAGTAWADNINAGQAFIGPDGLPYEIATVVSATSITLASNYKGVTASGQAYRIMPVQGYLRDLATQAANLVLSFAAVRDGIGQGVFPGGSVGTPGFRFSGDEDTGVCRIAANILALVANGVECLRASGGGFSGTMNGGTIEGITNFSLNGSGDSFILNQYTDSSVFGGSLAGKRARGSVSTPTAVLSGDVLAGLYGYSYTGSGWSGAIGAIRIVAAENHSTPGNGTYMDFAVTGVGNTGRSVRCVMEYDAHRPNFNNVMTSGASSYRWSGGYIQTAWVVTSDERTKQDISVVPDEWLDAWGDLEWVRYKVRDAVDKKGWDAARWHIGLIAQAVRDAFIARGLDATQIGLLCYDAWEATEATYDEGGNLAHPAREAGDRWSLRYDECQAMEAAWQRREIGRQEVRITSQDAIIADLSARLQALEAA